MTSPWKINKKIEFYQLTLDIFIGKDRERRNKYFETAINTSKRQ